MSYQIDPVNGDIVINGFDKGIGDSPYQGFTDLKNVNIATIPGEASVAPSTVSRTAPSQQSASATPLVSGTALNVTIAGGRFIENNQAITISAGSTVSGLTTGTYIYYVRSATATTSTNEQISLGVQYGGSDQISFGTSGTCTLSTVDIVLGPRGPLGKNYIQESVVGTVGAISHWLLDSNGRVWSDIVTTTAPSNGGFVPPVSNAGWTYTNNTVDNTSFGNGLVFMNTVGASGLDGWLFLFRNEQIDYLKIINNGSAIAASSLAWVYGWNPATGTTNNTAYLTSASLYGNVIISHEAIVTPGGFGGFVNYCDAYNIGQFSQFAFGTAFDPLNTATYNFTKFGILPTNDIAQCMSYLNGQILIGGRRNLIYPWDLVSSNPSNPLIQLPENDTVNIVTVKQNAYAFTGQRGRIYITNGSQADLWKKIPDHISGTVQPPLSWGAACYNQNKLFFSVYQGTPISGADFPASGNVYGGVWAIDVNNQQLYLSNVLSSGLYSGYVPALFAFTTPDALTGYGFFAGWYDSSTSSGIDVSSDIPYTGGQSVIVSDMIPIGTLLQPITPMQFEYKLSMPLLSGESVQLLAGSSFADYVNNTFTSIGTTAGTGSATTGTLISDNFPATTQQSQWMLVKAVLTGKATTPTFLTPSYNRLTEIRIKNSISSS